MGIRETLNKNQGITIGVTGAIIAISLFFIVRHLLSGGGPKIPPAPTKAYFSLDEGDFFADDIKLVAPYEKDGKTAFRAHVFKCKDSEQQFLGYLSCFSPEAKKVLEDARRAGQRMPVEEADAGLLVKKPGKENKWIRMGERGFDEVMQIKCPDGSFAHEVYP